MGINRSKPILIKFFNKKEIQIISSLGYSPHPDISLQDIIFIPQGITKIMALDNINYFYNKNNVWKKSDFLVMNSLTSIEIYIKNYCETKQIKIGNKIENIFIYKM